jgi:hypothetical protein
MTSSLHHIGHRGDSRGERKESAMIQVDAHLLEYAGPGNANRFV